MPSTVTCRVEGGVAQVRLNRPDKLNALTLDTLEDLVTTARDLTRDRTLRGVVIGGEGDSFCAGLDFATVLKDPPRVARSFVPMPWRGTNLFQEACWAWRRVPVPVVAAVHGHCYGGGLQIALAADLRMTTADAQWSVMEAKWGLVPDMSGVQALSQQVRMDVAKRLTMTGEVVSGAQAVELGLASEVHDEPFVAATRFLEQVAQRSPGCRRRHQAALRPHLVGRRPAHLRARAPRAGPAAGEPQHDHRPRGGDGPAGSGVRAPPPLTRATRLIADPPPSPRGAAWEGVPVGESQEVDDVRHVTCTLCEAMCSLEVRLDRDGAIASLRGHEADPLSRGHICPKAFALQDVHEDPDRLRRPVRRTGDGGWREVSWDEALDRSRHPARGGQREHGDDAVAVYLGNPNVHSLGALTHDPTLVRLLRTRNRFTATSVDQLPHQFVAWALYGHQLLLPVPDIDRTDLLLVFGANPMASNGSLMTVPDFPHGCASSRRAAAGWSSSTRAAPRRPRSPTSTTSCGRAPTRSCCWRWCASCCSRRGRHPPPYVDGVDAVRDAVADFTPERAEQVSGMPADAVRTPRARARRRAVGGRVRPDGRLDPGLRHGVPVGGADAQHPHRQPRPAGRRDAHHAGGRRRRPGRARAGPLRHAAQPGARAAGVRRRAARCRCCARRSRRPARARCGRC